MHPDVCLRSTLDPATFQMASAAATAAPTLPPSEIKLGEPLSVDFAIHAMSPEPSSPTRERERSNSPPSPYSPPSRSQTAPLPLRLDTKDRLEIGTSSGLLNDADLPLAASPMTATSMLHDAPPPQSATSPTAASRPASIALRVPATDVVHSANHPRSIAGYLDQHPNATVAKAIRKTYPKPMNPITRIVQRFTVKHNIIKGLSDAELQRWDRKHGLQAAEDAGWTHPDALHDEDDGEVGSSRPRPSELFWKMYLSILPTVQRHPLSGLCAPPLLGSTTTMPLTIVSLIPDIMKHYRDVIVRAKREVFLVTNYWQ